MTIKELREQYRLTQQALSDITGIPKRSIENWEGEKRVPPEYIPTLIESHLELRKLKERH